MSTLMQTATTTHSISAFLTDLRRKTQTFVEARRLARQPKWLRDTSDDDLIKVGLTRQALLNAIPSRCGVF